MTFLGWSEFANEGWGFLPVRSAFSPRHQKHGAASGEYLSLLASAGVIPYAEKGDVGNKAPEDMSKCKLVFKGDFVINSMNFGIGSFGVSNYDGICSPVYLVLQPNNQLFNTSFLSYIFHTKQFQHYAQSFGNGILAHRAAVGWDELKNISLPVPPLNEQKAIADFLDRELAQIDALIERQTDSILCLEERRVVIIRESVLRGLDKTTPLVDSEVPWVAGYPRDWRLLKLKHFALLESGRDYKEIEVLEEGYPVFGSGGEFARASSYLYSGESVLFGRKGTIDKPLYVNGCFWTVDTMYYTRLRTNVNPKFVYYWATTLPYKAFSTNTALPSMTSGDIREFKMPTPQVEEQLMIVNFLDSETAAIDQLISKSKLLILASQERRQSLISAAVTGKIDISKVG